MRESGSVVVSAVQMRYNENCKSHIPDKHEMQQITQNEDAKNEMSKVRK